MMKQRIQSIDIVRGLIMIIMTLDHTRDFLHFPVSPTDMQTTAVILFFTRWITHFCAPTFVFLSGVSVFLAAQRKTKKELSLFLLKRGLWLILSDVLIISLLFSFDPQYHIIVLEVLWATGFGMILLAALIHTSRKVIAAIALLIFFGHNMLDYVQLPAAGVSGSLAISLLGPLRGMIPIGGNRVVAVLYAGIPWSAVALLGYVFGHFYRASIDKKRRRDVLLIAGISLTVLFIVLRMINHYGDPRPWTVQQNLSHTILSFFNTTKQVPSLLFLAMTLGPVLILLSITEKISNRFTAICQVYGNVPYLYFILHLLVLRIINIVLIMIDGVPMHTATEFPLVWQADGFGHPLWQVYLFWIGVVALFYFPCKWYGDYKRAHTHWWLSYL